MERTWKPMTGGILSLIAGIIQLLSGIGLTVGVGMLKGLVGGITELPVGLLAILGIPWIILGIIAIVGGIFAIKRAIWGLALAGSICALFHPITWFLGIASIIFVIMGKGEFE